VGEGHRRGRDEDSIGGELYIGLAIGFALLLWSAVSGKRH
tara:strand:- start:156 stop:275 length:120 start_codon:yes stop_codon:yes gene_type:complete